MDKQQKHKLELGFLVALTKRLLMGGAVVFVLAQFVRPDRTNPPVNPQLSFRSYPGVPTNVMSAMERSCFDCHSNETRWPWYSNITPVNFLVVDDVVKGRERVNLSEWGRYKSGRKQTFLEEIYDQVYNHEMPAKKYLLLHPDARLSDTDFKAICDWASAEQDRLAAGDEAAADSSANK